jgi:NTE family protein
VFIRPDLGSITVASFERCGEAVASGERAATAALPALERLALSPEAYEAYRAARAARVASAAPPVLGAERIVNRSRVSDRVITARLQTSAGGLVDARQIEKQLDQVYGLELFESVYYDVVPGPQGNVLTVTARERSWGPNYLQGGIAAFEDFEHPNFNAALAYSRTAVNRLNGEWRTGLQVGQEPAAWTEFHQPLDAGLRDFLDLGLLAGERSMNVFDDRGHKLGELGIRHYGLTFAGGREIGTWGEVRAGIVREAGSIRVTVGEPGLPERRNDTGEAFAQVFVDKLDEIPFPHHGGSLRARYSAGLDALGSTVTYRQADIEASVAATRGRFTGVLGGESGTTLQGAAPLERRFFLGGLGRLSGLEQDELVGQNALLLRALLHRRMVDFQLLPVYAGLSAEYGSVFEARSKIALANGIVAGSVFLGADTPLGPFCLAFGLAEAGRTNYYMTLGQLLGGRRPGFQVR